jgi:NAD(P)-dependent dehydrogenase (short-subunit alcohol dehydrogenase family)
VARKAVVTGGTGGLGFHVAQQLHQRGFTVTVVGRDPGHGADAVRRIGGDTRFLEADLSSLEQVRDLGALLAEEGPLQLLVNNVGGMWSTRWETADGIEAGFALNHLSPVVLTQALLGALRAGAPSRIVAVTSSSIVAAVVNGPPTYEEVEQDGEYYGMAVTVAGSGRFAMIDDGLGVQLVPWTAALEGKLGQHVSGVARGDGGVDWVSAGSGD